MKKFYFSIFSFLLVFGLNAQVNITYQVDVTEYLAGGATLAAEGIRIGGDFASNGAVDVTDWTPSDANSAMTDEGDNIWSITVEYPGTSVGNEQMYKFVNGDWGMNEGTDETSTIATDGCGIDDGAGNVNRTLTIPDADATFCFVWDACTACESSAVTDIVAINDFMVAPNPTTDKVRFTYSLNSNETVNIAIYNVVGTQVANVFNGTGTQGSNTVEANLSNLNSGIYLYQIQVGDSVAGGRLMKL